MFYDCTALKHISIPASVTDIERSAFDGCTALETISLTNNLHLVVYGAFDECKSLTAVYYRGRREEWEQIQIDGKTASNYPLTSAALYCYTKGDVNIDYKIDMTDLVLLCQYLIEAVKLDAPAIYNADCNEDTLVDADDVLYLLRQLMQQSERRN